LVKVGLKYQNACLSIRVSHNMILVIKKHHWMFLNFHIIFKVTHYSLNKWPSQYLKLYKVSSPKANNKGDNKLNKWVINIIRKRNFSLIMNWCNMHTRNSCFFPLGRKRGSRCFRFDVPNVFPPNAHKVVNHMCLDQVFNVF
jgi:hypothetical protein